MLLLKYFEKSLKHSKLGFLKISPIFYLFGDLFKNGPRVHYHKIDLAPTIGRFSHSIVQLLCDNSMNTIRVG